MGKKKSTSSPEQAEQPSKTSAIIEYVQQNPDAPNYEVANALNERFGWSMTAAYVSTIKSQKGLSSGGRRKKTGAAPRSSRAMTRQTARGDDLAELMQAVADFVERAGSLERARQALDAVERIRNLG